MHGTEFQLTIFASLLISFISGWAFGYFIDRRYLKRKMLKKDVLKEYSIIKKERDSLVKEIIETKEYLLKRETQLTEEIKIMKDGLKLLRKKNTLS